MSRFARCTHQADRLPAVVRRSDLYGSVEADHGLIALFGVVHAIALLEVASPSPMLRRGEKMLR